MLLRHACISRSQLANGVYCVSVDMIIAKRYTIEQIEGVGVFRIINLDAPFCPDCGTLCSGYDTRLRSVISSDGQTNVYRLRRLQCLVCDALHIEQPDFIFPRKRYAAEVIDKVLNGRSEDCPADDRTMRRWLHENHPPEVSGVLEEGVVLSTHDDKKEGIL